VQLGIRDSFDLRLHQVRGLGRNWYLLSAAHPKGKIRLTVTRV